MSDRSAEPRGLTIADLMILVAGVAFAMILPDAETRPWQIGWHATPAELAYMWLQHLSEQLGKFCIVPALVAIARCGRYRRPIRAPEFLALAVGWQATLRAVTHIRGGWITLYLTTYPQPGSTSVRLDPSAHDRWNLGWLGAGCVGAACLAIGPIRRRLPAWAPPVLLLLAWAASDNHLSWVVNTTWRPFIPRPIKAFLSDWSQMIFLLPLELPVAASLTALGTRSRSRWSVIAWLALALALVARLCMPAGTFLGIFVIKTHSFLSPESRSLHIFTYFILPPVVIALEILLLTWAARIRRNPAEAPA